VGICLHDALPARAARRFLERTGEAKGWNVSLVKPGLREQHLSQEEEQDLIDDDAFLIGKVWELSRDPDGCRVVQNALEGAPKDEVRLAIASELRGHVCEALYCPNANHVVQTCIKTMPAPAVQFILDELHAKGAHCIVDAAKHRYSCRSLQRLLEHLTPAQLAALVDILLANAISLSRHIYGNYVVQHVAEYGTEAQRRYLARQLAHDSMKVCANCFACAVVSKALEFGCREDACMLARAFAAHPRLVVSMARGRYGHVAVCTALQLLDGAELADMRAHLLAQRNTLRTTRYGRIVVTNLESINR
jgi:hypothetical protein